jgi:ribosomal protein L18E
MNCIHLSEISGSHGGEYASIIRAIALMMEAPSTSETSVNFYQITRRNNPEDSDLLDSRGSG